MVDHEHSDEYCDHVCDSCPTCSPVQPVDACDDLTPKPRATSQIEAKTLGYELAALIRRMRAFGLDWADIEAVWRDAVAHSTGLYGPR